MEVVGDHTAKSRLAEVRIIESQFADDTAVYATTRDAFEQIAREFIHTAKGRGVKKVNTSKTKGMAVGCHLSVTE